MAATQMTDDTHHLDDRAEEYRSLAFQAVHGHERQYANSRRLPQRIRDWLYDGSGTIDEPVAEVLAELQTLHVLEIAEAIDSLRDRTGDSTLKKEALAVLRRRLSLR